jgi:hypothetical protein
MNEQAPSIVIAPEHQSAPNEHFVVTEMRKAAEEIDNGTFRPELAEDDYFYIGPEQLIAMHPRVAEALAKFEQEVKEAKHSQEAIELSQMHYELACQAAEPQQWDGQGRWIGRDNEQMRTGELLTAQQFMNRLSAVIGDRVTMNRFAVAGRVALLVRDPSPEQHRLITAAPRIDYNAELRSIEQTSTPQSLAAHIKELEQRIAKQEAMQQTEPDYLKGKVQVATLQWPVSTEWMVMAFNEYGVPKYAKHLGWRTTLLTLIAEGVITEDEAHKAFPVKDTEASAWYRQQLYQRRNA